MKDNIRKVYAYLIELNLLSQNLIGKKLIETTKKFELDIEPTINHINRVNKAWEAININLDMHFSEVAKNNLLTDISKAKESIASDIISCRKFEITNKEEILGELSNQLENLNVLENYISNIPL